MSEDKGKKKEGSKPKAKKLPKGMISVEKAWSQVSKEHPFDFENQEQMVSELKVDVMLENDVECFNKGDFDKSLVEYFNKEENDDDFDKLEKEAEQETKAQKEEKKRAYRQDLDDLIERAAEALNRRKWLDNPNTKELLDFVRSQKETLINKYKGALLEVEQCASQEDVEGLKVNTTKDLLSKTSYFVYHKIDGKLSIDDYESLIQQILDLEDEIKRKEKMFYKELKSPWAGSRSKLEVVVKEKAKELEK